MKRFIKKYKMIMLGLVGLFLLVYALKFADHYPATTDLKHKSGFFGVTFSTKFSDELELDWKEVYAATLDELKVKNIRIPIYWDEIEHEEGVYNFSNYDYLLDEGEKRGARFIITVGRRQPRWPECHSPAWLNRKSEIEARVHTLVMVRDVVNRYKDRKSIEYWQVENEPFFGAFGVCPEFDESLLHQEVETVRSLDSRPIIITGSGEMSSWQQEAKIGDIFGTTMYRVVYNSWLGYLKYPIGPSFYRLKAYLAGLSPDRLMLLELQAEPWVPQGKMIYLTTDQIDRTMSVEQFRANLQYAINLDWQRAYTWGVEWWYWQKKYGNPMYWQIATEIFD